MSVETLALKLPEAPRTTRAKQRRSTYGFEPGQSPYAHATAYQKRLKQALDANPTLTVKELEILSRCWLDFESFKRAIRKPRNKVPVAIPTKASPVPSVPVPAAFEDPTLAPDKPKA